MKKLLDSEWLRTVQFFLNTVQKRGNWMQKKVIKQAFWLVNEQRSSRIANQILLSNQARALDGAIFSWLRNHLRLSARTKLRREFRVRKVQNILHANFFMFILLRSNHTVFLVQFGINLHLVSFSKSQIALAEAARAISAFWKTHSCKLIPNWTRNRMITYSNYDDV